ncbi:unnamed protein product, partial [Brassica rapa subsp. narinosa]
KQRKRRGRRENPPPFGPGETKDGRREKTLRSSSSTSCKNKGIKRLTRRREFHELLTLENSFFDD